MVSRPPAEWVKSCVSVKLIESQIIKAQPLVNTAVCRNLTVPGVLRGGNWDVRLVEIENVFGHMCFAVFTEAAEEIITHKPKFQFRRKIFLT